MAEMGCLIFYFNNSDNFVKKTTRVLALLSVIIAVLTPEANTVGDRPMWICPISLLRMKSEALNIYKIVNWNTNPHF